MMPNDPPFATFRFQRGKAKFSVCWDHPDAAKPLSCEPSPVLNRFDPDKYFYPADWSHPPRQTIPTEKRRVGMVFQEYALFPHLRVAITSPSGSAT